LPGDELARLRVVVLDTLTRYPRRYCQCLPSRHDLLSLRLLRRGLLRTLCQLLSSLLLERLRRHNPLDVASLPLELRRGRPGRGLLFCHQTTSTMILRSPPTFVSLTILNSVPRGSSISYS